MPYKTLFYIALGLVTLFVIIHFTRPLMPVDETRYLSVAWNMAVHDYWLVPHLNDVAYHHKPPMLFWLVRSSWFAFGEHIWAARLIIFGVVLTVFFLSARLLKMLAKNNMTTTTVGLLLLASMPAFLIYASMIMFDCLLTLALLIALLGLLKSDRDGGIKGWVLFGLGLGLGALIKGPVILLYAFPCALLGPWWYRWQSDAAHYRRWYAGVGLGVLIGAVIGLSWAIPAAIAGGTEYAQAIFMKQSAGRMVQAFDHREPFLFFVPVVMIFMIPVLLWPRAMKSITTIPKQFCDGTDNAKALAFLACWILPPLFFFSVIHSKQIHYMMPLMPGIAMMFALLIKPQTLKIPTVLAVTSFIVVIGAHIIGSTTLLPRYDLTAVANEIQKYKDHPIAVSPKYDGEYGFLARLDKSVTSLGRENIDQWREKNPNGVLIVRFEKNQSKEGYAVLYEQPFRADETLTILSAQ